MFCDATEEAEVIDWANEIIKITFVVLLRYYLSTLFFWNVVSLKQAFSSVWLFIGMGTTHWSSKWKKRKSL